MAFAFVVIIAVVLIKYKPAYEITLNGEELGYTDDKSIVENSINEYVNESGKSVAFLIEENLPQYNFKFVSDLEEIDTEEVMAKVKENKIVTYKSYAIVLNDEIKTYVDTIEEADQVVADIKTEFEKDVDLDLGIREVFSNNIQELDSEEISVAKASLDTEINQMLNIESYINGIALSKPLTVGSVSSRYGVSSRIRSSLHTGLDIAAPNGTPINPCSSGTVTYAGYKGSYGLLLIIDHGDGVETYYAHCSKLYVKAGETVTTKETVAAVGSTGNSTGSHLHLEIRLNGNTLNPQNYLY